MVEDNKNSNENKSSSGKGCIIAIVLTLILIVVCIASGVSFLKKKDSESRNNSGSGQERQMELFTRDATMSDLYFQYSSDLTLGFKFEFTPSIDISGLSITVLFCDKNKQLVVKKTKYIGNVVKGGQYSFTYSITEFSVSQLFKIDQCTAKVESGSISYWDYIR